MLVLPPWGRLYQWKSPDLEQTKIPWSTFFDLPSLREHIPVIEFDEYLKCNLSYLLFRFIIDCLHTEIKIYDLFDDINDLTCFKFVNSNVEQHTSNIYIFMFLTYEYS